ncbi:RdgB/HAM1 family non-canonical purine NTP pyrophosphatase [Cuneatibacter caecimuris]|uniref:dITP/XTP pyrophosphatase n=1 Tax=Cuneatibacter caecimuris TaxID=1796618 RepID=A0A4Q7PIU1_9FIRM|nr:RdgB/HAM1 family non-canonical purine NTP pyrophosphatase [Cuneatibacter caecimuris]RZT00517.1 XTP/dITP diphosphohydrolase [Cuneatibacter caecimuris]
MKQKVIFATSNEGKMKEIRMLLADLPVEVLSMKEAGITADIIEDGNSFEANALIKVRALREFTDGLILADDSGLEIDCLGGEPGVYSARYMGEETSYTVKNAALISRVEGIEGNQRSARFRCVIAASLPDGREMTASGSMEGLVAEKPAGAGGFGYDPILWLPEYGCTAAELTAEEKNRISHRGKALRAIKEKLLELYPEWKA